MNIGDKVFVINWMKRYTSFTKWDCDLQQRVPVFPWNFPVSSLHYPECSERYERLPNYTKKGTINKKEPTIRGRAIFKEFEYEVVDKIIHPSNGRTILLLSSTNESINALKTWVQIEEDGVSFLKPDDFEKKRVSDLLSSYLGKLSQDDLTKNFIESLPPEIFSYLYDKNDNVLFGSSTVKGLVSYKYIDKKYSKEPYHLWCGWEIKYDGKGNKKLKGKDLVEWDELKKLFPHMKFE